MPGRCLQIQVHKKNSFSPSLLQYIHTYVTARSRHVDTVTELNLFGWLKNQWRLCCDQISCMPCVFIYVQIHYKLHWIHRYIHWRHEAPWHRLVKYAQIRRQTCVFHTITWCMLHYIVKYADLLAYLCVFRIFGPNRLQVYTTVKVSDKTHASSSQKKHACTQRHSQRSSHGHIHTYAQSTHYEIEEFRAYT